MHIRFSVLLISILSVMFSSTAVGQESALVQNLTVRQQYEQLFAEPVRSVEDLKEKKEFVDKIHKIAAILWRISQDHVTPVLPDTLLSSMLHFVDHLDPHSSYIPPEDLDAYLDRRIGKCRIGLGIKISRKTRQHVQVEEVIDGGSAAKAGIVAGTRIIAIDEMPVNTLSDAQISELLQDGTPGTAVTVLVEAQGTSVRRSMTMARTSQQRCTMTHRSFGDQYGIITVPCFVGNSDDQFAHEFSRIVDELFKENNGHLNGFVLDLRENHGGAIASAAHLFSRVGNSPGVTILTLRDRTGEHPFTEFGNPRGVAVEGDPRLKDVPLLVLVGPNTASASEIFAGAIKVYGLGVIAGTKRTYGKGNMQRMTMLEGGKLGAVMLTTALFYPAGILPVQGRGVEPDIYLSESDEHAPPAEVEEDFPNALPADPQTQMVLLPSMKEKNPQYYDVATRMLDALSLSIREP